MTNPERANAAIDSARDVFLDDVLTGLSQPQKTLSPKYFYDYEGSVLFDAICELPEYHVTRTELSLLGKYAKEMVRPFGKRVRVVEPGAGSGLKTKLLLEALGPERCADYVPVDISGDHLKQSAERLRAELPWLRVSPVVADFTQQLPIGQSDDATSTVFFFPGGTLGNFAPADARGLLARFRRLSNFVLVGLDLKKSPALLHAAYNDAAGLTARFNKNVLRRINEELGGDFNAERFEHYAPFNPIEGRIEMHLVSLCTQRVTVAGAPFDFARGESLLTEFSYKYELNAAERLGRSVGLDLERVFTDPEETFGLLSFRFA